MPEYNADDRSAAGTVNYWLQPGLHAVGLLTCGHQDAVVTEARPPHCVVLTCTTPGCKQSMLFHSGGCPGGPDAVCKRSPK